MQIEAVVIADLDLAARMNFETSEWAMMVELNVPEEISQEVGNLNDRCALKYNFMLHYFQAFVSGSHMPLLSLTQYKMSGSPFLSIAIVSGIARTTILLFLLSIIFVFLSLFSNKSKNERVSRQVIPVAISAFLASVVFSFLPKFVDFGLNRIDDAEIDKFYPSITEEVESFHRSLWIADMHADTLLWSRSRDLIEFHRYGHVDLPRLLKGNVALQTFTIVTSIPSGMSMDLNRMPSVAKDSVAQKSIIELWGWEAISHKAARLKFQVSAFHEAVERSNGSLRCIRTREEFRSFILDREARLNAKEDPIVAGILGIEGLHALDGNLENVDAFYNLGIRMMGFAHFFDNEVGGSAHGIEKNGITELGIKVLKRMEELNILVDVAHSSKSLIDDILRLSTRPIISSHGGVKGVCDNERNLEDKHIIGIAKSGGLICIGYFKPAICGETYIEGIINSILYVKNLVGIDYVGLGSDFDGAVVTPFDTSKLIYMTQHLLSAGLSKNDVRKIMGGNIQRLLLEVLPQ